MKNKKLIKGLVAFFSIACSVALPAHASDDDISFGFYLQPEYNNSYTPSRYRQTTNTSNKWKVNLAYSEEGAGTKATFWLALDDIGYTRASDTHDVTQGTGAHYYNAYSSASQHNVCLGAENNNYSANSYWVSGYWDEETN